MHELFDRVFWGNSVREWLIAFGIVVLATVTSRALRSLVLVRLKKLADTTSSTLDDFLITVLQRSVMPLLYILCVYAGLRYLELPATADRILIAVMMAIAIYYIVKTISGLLGYVLQRYASSNTSDQSQVKQARGILLIVRIILWLVGFTFLVDNLGYNITTIVTGLGIGGIAIALAAQAVLGDLFSYFVIFFDKPFETGDFIVVGDKSGVVEYVGLKTTRLRAMDGEQLIMSNTDLTNSRVQNFKRMEKRRVLFSIGITYETAPALLEKIPTMIRELIQEMKDAEFDRAHFAGFGDSALNFEVVYYVQVPDYLLYRDIHQAVCLAILKRFTNEGIEFAYPTQKIFLDRSGPQRVEMNRS